MFVCKLNCVETTIIISALSPANIRVLSCALVEEIPSADVNMVALRRALSKRRRLLVDTSAVSSHSSDSLSPACPAPVAVTTAVLSV